jgi:hypothetical protein
MLNFGPNDHLEGDKAVAEANEFWETGNQNGYWDIVAENWELGTAPLKGAWAVRKAASVYGVPNRQGRLLLHLSRDESFHS